MKKPRVVVLGDFSRPEVAAVLQELNADLSEWADEVAIEDTSSAPGTDIAPGDLAIVIGGDGAVIGQSRRLAQHDIPLVGINCGRLGFLAAFDPNSLRTFAADVFGGSPPLRRHMLLEVLHERAGKTEHAIAVNDAVVAAGPPYRMIVLGLRIGGVEGPALRGDGLIVASPTGPTAHNLCAGGSTICPGVDALVAWPLTPQSLAFRPIVMDAEQGVELELIRGNEGSTLVIDGQQSTPLAEGDRITVRRHSRTIPLVTRPDEPFWRILLERMRWAVPPVFR